jgi:hypothetical protein
MSFPALAVACMATQQLPDFEDEEFGLSTPDDAALDIEWVIYESMGAGTLLRVRSVAWL